MEEIDDGILKQIKMEPNTYQTIKIVTKQKFFPVKIKVFANINTADFDLAVSFTHKFPDKKQHDYITHDFELLIEYNQGDIMYISILSRNKWFGYIGCSFNQLPQLKSANVKSSLIHNISDTYNNIRHTQYACENEHLFWKYLKNMNSDTLIDPLQYIFDTEKIADFVRALQSKLRKDLQCTTNYISNENPGNISTA